YPSFREELPPWYTLEEGKKSFREGDFGSALTNFEEARNEWRSLWSKHERVFISLLSIPEAQHIGDSLENIERYIHDRRFTDAAYSLSQLIYYVGRDTLNNSVKTTLHFFNLMKDYPEAEYWIAEVYRLEGEKEIAISQYNKALSGVDIRSPIRRSEILYKIAEVYKESQNYNEMERSLVEILRGDTLWEESENFVRNAMKRTLESGGINQFLKMYRYDKAQTEKAHRLLGYYYYMSGRYILAETHLMFAVLIENTLVIEEVIHKKYDFSFETLDALIPELTRRADVKKYMEDSDYYKTLYYLGAALYANGKEPSAREIWLFLSKNNNEGGEWSLRSGQQIRKPFIEKAIAMP
ncbi:MAG: hypothetical protein LBV68_07255, partial [Spirochaetaceae bacterium]|nr:hypothetical protein [Spirochaetaceae bacterium]